MIAKHSINISRFIVVAFFLFSNANSAVFELRTLEGEITTLNSYLSDGKWTLVMIWKTDCSICKIEQPKMCSFHVEHKDKDAKVIGVSIDGYENIDEINQYLQTNTCNFENLVGKSDLVAFNYELATKESLRGTPTYLLYDPSGKIVGHNPGPVRKEALEEFIKNHTNQSK